MPSLRDTDASKLEVDPLLCGTSEKMVNYYGTTNNSHRYQHKHDDHNNNNNNNNIQQQLQQEQEQEEQEQEEKEEAEEEEALPEFLLLFHGFIDFGHTA